MTVLRGVLRANLARIASVAILVTLYGFARLPSAGFTSRDELQSRFRFDRIALASLDSVSHDAIRSVHPDLQHISAWISSVGGGVALADLDNDGLANEVCHVDPRFDEVIVSGVGRRATSWPVFTLSAEPLFFDRSTMSPMGCLPGDFNEDGWIDLLVYYWGRSPAIFLRQVPRPGPPESLERASFEARELLEPIEKWFTNAATAADIDGDGHLDLIIGNYFPDDSQVLDVDARGAAQMQDSMSRAYNGGRNRILLWRDGDGGPQPFVEFTDAELDLGLEYLEGWTLALGAADLDGDLLPELVVVNDFGPDRLFHNRSRTGSVALVPVEGRRTLTSPSSKILGRDSFKGMGVDFGDLNGDGYLDIYISNITEEFALEESQFAFLSTGEVELFAEGIAPYVEASERLGLSRSAWAWGARLADFDNDGTLEAIQATGFVKGNVNRWPELHEIAMGNDTLVKDPRNWPRIGANDDLSGHSPNPFFVRDKTGRYFDVAPQLGLADSAVARGIAVADVDGDGDLDFAIANQWEPSFLYMNEGRSRNRFLQLELLLPTRADSAAWRQATGERSIGHGCCRPAIGASVSMTLPGGRILADQVDGGSGHSGVSSPTVHFGLGEVPPADFLDVLLQWRGPAGGLRRESIRLRPGRYAVLLGDGAPVRIEGR